MKQILKQGVIFGFLLFLTFAIFPQEIFAINYGEGNYGEKDYSNKENPAPGVISGYESSPSVPVCENIPPGVTASWLYGAIAQDGSSILLYFTKADDPVDHYVLEFGTKAGEYSWGADNIGGKDIRTYLVQSLQPETTYYFRVRGDNGCAIGSWSNEISATTTPLFAFGQLKIVDMKLTTFGSYQSSQETSEADSDATAEDSEKTTDDVSADNPSSYIVNVKVTDLEEQPVVGAKVTIHSQVQETTTDEQGIAHFKNVEPGDHRVLIAYSGYEGEQNINLSGNVKEFNLSVTVKQQEPLTQPVVLMVVGGLLTVIVILIALMMVRTKKS